MKCRKAQEWADFLGCYIVIFNGDVRVLDNFPKNIMFSSDGDIISFSIKDDTIFDFGYISSSIVELNIENKLYTPKLTSGDKVIVWDGYFDKNTIPAIMIFSRYNNNCVEVESRITSETYRNYIKFDKELAGLTLGELENKLKLKILK